MKKSKKSMIQTVLFMLILAAVIFGCYYLVQKNSENRAKQEAEKAAQQSEYDKLLEMDITGNYPQTPRAVLKLYCRILQCMYNDELVPSEIEALAVQLRVLFDDEFLTNNPFDSHVDTLTSEVAEYQLLERTITSYQIDSVNNMDEWTKDGEQFASLYVCFALKEGSSNAKLYERFLLRKDADQLWKIVGWEKVDAEEMK